MTATLRKLDTRALLVALALVIAVVIGVIAVHGVTLSGGLAAGGHGAVAFPPDPCKACG